MDRDDNDSSEEIVFVYLHQYDGSQPYNYEAARWTREQGPYGLNKTVRGDT